MSTKRSASPFEGVESSGATHPGRRRSYDDKELKKISVMIHRKIPDERRSDAPVERAVRNPEKIVIVRRREEGRKPIFDRAELYQNAKDSSPVERESRKVVKISNEVGDVNKKRRTSLDLVRYGEPGSLRRCSSEDRNAKDERKTSSSRNRKSSREERKSNQIPTSSNKQGTAINFGRTREMIGMKETSTNSNNNNSSNSSNSNNNSKHVINSINNINGNNHTTRERQRETNNNNNNSSSRERETRNNNNNNSNSSRKRETTKETNNNNNTKETNNTNNTNNTKETKETKETTREIIVRPVLIREPLPPPPYFFPPPMHRLPFPFRPPFRPPLRPPFPPRMRLPLPPPPHFYG